MGIYNKLYDMYSAHQVGSAAAPSASPYVTHVDITAPPVALPSPSHRPPIALPSHTHRPPLAHPSPTVQQLFYIIGIFYAVLFCIMGWVTYNHSNSQLLTE